MNTSEIDSIPGQMDEINESDEIVLEQEAKVKEPLSKQRKMHKNWVKEERKIFDSGEHFKKEDEGKRMHEEAMIELENQAKQMEIKTEPTQKKSMRRPNNKPVYTSKIRWRYSIQLNTLLS